MIRFIVLVLLLLQTPAINVVSINNSFPLNELKALQDLYYNTKGPYWTWKQNGKKWNFTEVNPNPCYEQWEGIECTSNCLGISACNVKNVTLVDYNLTGVLSNSIGSFHELQWLNLRSNLLHYTIPSEIGNLTKLTMLDLSHNRLSTTLPVSIGQMASLQVLAVANNLLFGNIPCSIGNLSNLRVLRLNENFFQTHIPKEIGNLHRLKTLDLASNMLSGEIPESIAQLSELEVLELSFNTLNRNIPMGIGQLSNLTHLSLAFNYFYSTVPRSIFHLPNLRWLDLQHGCLVGTIPVDIGNMTELRVLMLGWNTFTHSLPDSLCGLSNLEVFSLTNNFVGGSLPTNITNLTKLIVLDLTYNMFSGAIPPTLFEHLIELRMFSIYENVFAGKLPNTMQHLSQLAIFSVGYNQLSGFLPDSIAFCKNLIYLSFSGNFFIGSFPAEYGNLHNLISLYVFSNHMYGTIPSNITSLSRLIDLELSYNSFSGTIPETLGNMQHLLYLGLNDNFFQSSLPQSFGNLNGLLACTFQNNRFTGTLPSTIGSKWSRLEVLLLQSNFFSGRIDVIANMQNLTNLNISCNRFSGSVNNLLLNFLLLYLFDVSNNKFTGSLNHVFDQIPNLKKLNLAHNQFSGNLDAVFFSKSLSLVDISDNAFSGTLPVDVFEITMLQSFAAVKNCLTGTLPSEMICNSGSLQTLALDGLHTAEHCQDRFFPDFSYITSYQLGGALKGSLPSCLFNMTTLQTLHLSGNGFTGSIPSNVMVSKSLSDVSLSYNQLTGSIPDWMQEKAWKSLDISFNKLNGVLKNTFAPPDESSSLTMIVNRLSGDIPTSLLRADQIDMLQGNIFRCDTSGMLGDSSRSLPRVDAESSTYDCGSDSVNTALYIWLIIAGSVLGGVIVIAAVSKNNHARKALTTEDKQPVIESNDIPFAICSAPQQLIVNIQTQLRSWLRNIDLLLSIYRMNDINVENGKDYEGQCQVEKEKNVLDQDSNSIYLLGKSFSMIRIMAWKIASFALFILLPIYCILASSFSTHSQVYIWTVALAYLSGWVPAIVVFVIMTIFYLALHYHDIFHHHHHHDYFRVHFSFDHLYSFVSLHRLTRENVKKICVYFGIVLFNVIVVLAVNIAYVYTTTLNLNQSAIFFVEITISLFKISWGSFIVSYVFSRTLKRLGQYASDEQSANHMIEKLTFLSQLTIFNNIIAPFLADAFVDPDCFRYVINSQSAVTTSYDSQACYMYDFVVVGSTVQVKCHNYVLATISTLYNPPFVYSYQCTSALLNGFINVFIYRYLITGILLPCAKMILLYLDDQYGILDILYSYFDRLTSMINVRNFQRRRCFGEKKDQRESVIQLQSVASLTSNPILIDEQNATEIDKNTSNLDLNNDDSVSIKTASENVVLSKKISRRIFNKEAIIVAIIGDFAVLLTFGLTFPPLAFMIAISIGSNTYYHQLVLSRMITMLRSSMTRPVTNITPLHHDSCGQRRRSIWRLSKATVELLAPSEAEIACKQILADCGGDLMDLFCPVLPSLTILSAVFIGAFLFDILGDAVGVLRALWILLVMSTIPLMIWFGEYLYFGCVIAYNEFQHQKGVQQKSETEVEVE